MACRPNDLQRHKRVLQATLDTIAAHGVQAVTHCKITLYANVLLKSSTYYFSGIKALVEEVLSLFITETSAQYQQCFAEVANRQQAYDAIVELIFNAQVTMVRNMELMYQLYASCNSQPTLERVMQNWMRHSQQTLE